MSNQANSFLIRPQGELSLDRAQALKDELIRALAVSESLVIDLSRIVDMDLACLQVLYAAGRSARRDGKSFGFKGRLSAKLHGRLVACGFLPPCASDEAEGLAAALRGFGE